MMEPRWCETLTANNATAVMCLRRPDYIANAKCSVGHDKPIRLCAEHIHESSDMPTYCGVCYPSEINLSFLTDVQPIGEEAMQDGREARSAKVDDADVDGKIP